MTTSRATGPAAGPTADPTAHPTASTHRPRRAAVAAHGRPPRPGKLTTARVFGWRAVLKLRYDPDQLSSAVILPVMITLVFTYLFGGALAGSSTAYLQDLIPGVLVMAVVMISMFTAISLNTDVTKGIFDRFRGLALWRPGILIGAMLSDALRYLIATGVVLGLGLALGFRPTGGVLGVLGALLFVQVFAFCLGWMWSAIGLLLSSPESVNQLSGVMLFPLVFASNIFVQPRTMPDWLAVAVLANPITHAVTTTRALTSGTASTGALLAGVFACAVLLVVFAPSAMYLFRARGGR